MKFIYKLLIRFFRKNFKSTPVAVIQEQLHERRPLPIGMAEFEEWSDRIISGSMLPAEPHGMKFALAAMIMHLKPTEDFVDDAYFIHALRKSACNQIAHAKMAEHKAAAEAEYASKHQQPKQEDTNVVSIKEGAIEGEVLAKS